MWILSDYVPAKSRLIRNIPSNSVLYVSNGKYGRKKKQTFLTTVMNLWVVGMRD